MAPLVSRKLGSYCIESAIAEHGGGGAVYRARHDVTGELVALKHLPAPKQGEPRAERFEREMRLAGHLRHPHIVRVFEAVQLDDGDRLIAMELIDGDDLARRAAGGRILPTRAVAMIAQIGTALGYAHREGVVHRDIKPANAMITNDGHVFLMDFGLARHPDDLTVTAADVRLGTVAYMSPEQAEGRRATPKSDVYALTGLLFTLLTGRVPFPREDAAATMLAHISAPRPRPSDLRGDLTAFDELIAKGMATEWDKRLPLDKLLEGAQRAADRWAAKHLRVSGDDRPGPRPAPSPGETTLPLEDPTLPYSVSDATTVVVPPRRKPADVVVAALAKHRLPATMAAIFVLTIAVVLVLRSIAA
jgi:serine/threonine protein kinase